MPVGVAGDLVALVHDALHGLRLLLGEVAGGEERSLDVVLLENGGEALVALHGQRGVLAEVVQFFEVEGEADRHEEEERTML